MNEKKLVILVAALAQLTAQLIGNMVIVALPEMGLDLNLSVDVQNWIYLFYLITVISLTIPFSKIISQYGVKKCSKIGILISIISLLILTFTSDVNAILAARLLQGAASAILSISLYVMVVEELPKDEVGPALGLVGSFGYIGLTTAPTLMGFITEYISWRAGFLVLVPFFILQYVLMLKLDNEWSTEKVPIDNKGSLLYILFSMVFVYGLLNLDSIGITAIIVCIILFISFIKHEKGVKYPISNPKLLQNKNYLIGNYSAMVLYFVSTVISLVLTYHLTYINGLSICDIGLILLVSPVVMIFVSIFAGKLSNKYDSRLISAVAMLIFSVSMFMFCFVKHLDVFQIIVVCMIQGIGHGLFSSPNNKYVLTLVDKRDLPDASAFLASVKEYGKIMSSSVYTALFIIIIGDVDINLELFNQLLIYANGVMVNISVLLTLSAAILLLYSRYFIESEVNPDVLKLLLSLKPSRKILKRIFKG